MEFQIIVALDSQNGIGKSNSIPWHLPPDMAFFKQKTSTAKQNYQNVVIMGRKTWESLPEKFRPLPNRYNIILSRNTNYLAPDSVDIFTSIDSTLDHLNHNRDGLDQCFIMGGGQLYLEALPFTNVLWITRLQQTFNCDTFFPDHSEFKLCSTSEVLHYKSINYRFEEWRR